MTYKKSPIKPITNSFNVTSLTPHPGNPRRISDSELMKLEKSLKYFGDLSGIVFNKRTGHLVGGHQRVKCIPADSKITITEELKKATEQGTTALGYVLVGDEKFPVRIVDWNEATEKAANIAANKISGEWDMPALSEFLLALDHENFDMTLTGFDQVELENILAPTNEQIKIDDTEDILDDTQKISLLQIIRIELFRRSEIIQKSLNSLPDISILNLIVKEFLESESDESIITRYKANKAKSV